MRRIGTKRLLGLVYLWIRCPLRYCLHPGESSVAGNKPAPSQPGARRSWIIRIFSGWERVISIRMAIPISG